MVQQRLDSWPDTGLTDIGTRYMGKVIYVTGAPASGKSTTIKLVTSLIPGAVHWEYGAHLTAFLKAKGIDLADQDELRRKSSKLAIPSAIAELDQQLLMFVTAHRLHAHILIDSHPVTKEQYGFRITAFSQESFAKLQADEIWFFFTSPEVAVKRIMKEPSGRPSIDNETARMHTALQASVASSYGILVGSPVYLFNTDRDIAELADELVKRLTE